jgi:iron(III) transport system permease protein
MSNQTAVGVHRGAWPVRGRAWRSWPALAMLALMTVLLSAFLVWPLLDSLRGAFVDTAGRPTLVYLALVFQNPVYVEGFINALRVALCSTALAAAMGFSVAYVLTRFDVPGRNLLAALVPLPLVVPPFVGAIGIRQLLGQNGALNAVLVELGLMSSTHPIDWLRNGRFAAVVVLTALHLYPILYFNLAAALANVPAELEEAAENLGCTGLNKLRKITLPLIVPSVFASVTITFIWGLTELGVPLMCDYTRITSVQIFSGLKDLGNNPFVYALVTVVLVATVALYTTARLAFGRTQRALASKSTRRRTPIPLSGWRGRLGSATVALIVAGAALPNLSVVLVAFSSDWYQTALPSGFTLAHFQAALGHPMVVPSIANSLRYVTLSTFVDLLLGTATAYLLVRQRSQAARLIDALVMLPLAVPGLILAFGYLSISQNGRPLGMLNPARDPTALLVVAYAIRRLPFVVRAVAAGLQQISVALEEAAQSLGASPLSAFRRITLPLLSPHLLAGGVFAFALSMLEVSDSLILAQRQPTFPITKSIYELSQLLGDGRLVAAALGVWAMCFLGAAVFFARSLLGRALQGMFRL